MHALWANFLVIMGMKNSVEMDGGCDAEPEQGLHAWFHYGMHGWHGLLEAYDFLYLLFSSQAGRVC